MYKKFNNLGFKLKYKSVINIINSKYYNNKLFFIKIKLLLI